MVPFCFVLFFPRCAHFMGTGVEKADGWVRIRLRLIIGSYHLTLQRVEVKLWQLFLSTEVRG